MIYTFDNVFMEWFWQTVCDPGEEVVLIFWTQILYLEEMIDVSLRGKPLNLKIHVCCDPRLKLGQYLWKQNTLWGITCQFCKETSNETTKIDHRDRHVISDLWITIQNLFQWFKQVWCIHCSPISLGIASIFYSSASYDLCPVPR